MRKTDGAIRSDFDAHDYVVSLPIREVVRELVQILGSTTVAAIGGVKETRAVQQWTVDREPQRPHVLRFALQLALMLTGHADREFSHKRGSTRQILASTTAFQCLSCGIYRWTKSSDHC